MTRKQSIGLIPRLNGLGGMVTFQAKFREVLRARGIASTFDISDQEISALLVVGGTRHLGQLSNLRRRTVRTVQRLDGINWLHKKTGTGLRHYLRAESGNFLLRRIRSNYADHIIYQSAFVRDWWHQQYGQAPVPHSVIHNGVDLERFTPKRTEGPPKDRIRLLMVEGNISGGYELGLDTAVKLAQHLSQEAGKTVELAVAGNVSSTLRQSLSNARHIKFDWLGVIDNHQLPSYYRSAHMLFSADLNAACPNSVLEALACGLPVVAFDTGALPELITEKSGRIAEYGGDPWKLDPPDIQALSAAAISILQERKRLSAGARARAEETFGLDTMLEKYLLALGMQV